MALVNQYGREIRTNRPITDEIASAERDIYQDFIGKTLNNPDKVLRSEAGGKGIELYEDLLRDPQVGCDLQTRKLAVVGKEWEVVAASDRRQDVKIADYVKEVLMNFRSSDPDQPPYSGYDDARKMLLTGMITGFKPAEIMWEYSEGSVYIREVIGRAPRRFVFGLDRRLKLLTMGSMVEGEELPPRKFLVYRNVSDNGSPYGDALGRSLYWPVWFKKNSIKFWLIFADKFGSPTAVGKYPPGTAKKQQDDLLHALEAIQQESAIKIPNTMVIEFLEAGRTGSADTYEKLCNYMDKQISKILLGHSGSSESTPGRLGGEDQAKDIREDYIKADADSLCECQNNTLVRWIVDYNFAGVKQYPKVWIRTEPEEDLKALAERDVILVRDIRLPVSQDYFYETYGIPNPSGGGELVNPAPAAGADQIQTSDRFPATQKETTGQQFSESTTALVRSQREIDALADAAVSASGLDLQPLYAIVESAASFDDLQQRIAEAYTGLSLDAFREMLSRALFMADLQGRSFDA